MRQCGVNNCLGVLGRQRRNGRHAKSALSHERLEVCLWIFDETDSGSGIDIILEV